MNQPTKWKCNQCGKTRGKANPLKDGWKRFAVGQAGSVVTLCHECAVEFFDSMFAAFKFKPRIDRFFQRLK